MRHKVGEKAFSVAIPYAWKRLPTELKVELWHLNAFLEDI